MDEIINYGTNTPENFNPNVVRSMLGNINNGNAVPATGGFIFEITPESETSGPDLNSYYVTANKSTYELYQAITEGSTIFIKFYNNYCTPNIYYTMEESGFYEVAFSINYGYYDNYNFKYDILNFFAGGYSEPPTEDEIHFQRQLAPSKVSLIHLNTYTLKADNWPMEDAVNVQTIYIGVDKNTGETYLYNYYDNFFYNVNRGGVISILTCPSNERDASGYLTIEQETTHLQISNDAIN